MDDIQYHKSIYEHLALKLIKLDVEHLRDFSPDYKEMILSFLYKSSRYLKLGDLTERTFELYSKMENIQQELTELNYYIFNDSKNDYDYNKIENFDYNVKVFLMLFKIYADDTYYMCQSISNDNFSLYQLHHEFFEQFCMKFYTENDLPYTAIMKEYSSFSTSKIEYKRKLSVLRMLPSYKWFEINRSVKHYDHLKNKEKTLKLILDRNNEEYKKQSSVPIDYMTLFGIEPDTEENILASYYYTKQMRMIDLLKYYAQYKIDNHSFHSLDYLGFTKLLTKEYTSHKRTYKLINKDISERLSNQEIQDILNVFEELSLYGEVKEKEIQYPLKNYEPRFQKETYGEPYLYPYKITISNKVNWKSESNDMLIQLLKHFNKEDLLSFDSENNPIISL